MTTKQTRDEWLAAAVADLRSDFKKAGAPLPKQVRVSVGFPSQGARPSAKQRIGECWDGNGIGDKITQIYISPVLDDPATALGILVHELVHAAVGNACGHKGPFRKVALKVGLEGKMTSTSEGPELTARLKALARKIGRFPHSKLNLQGRKKQTTRMIKCECDDCGYICRTTRTWIEELGAPICPGCEEQMDAEVAPG